MRRLVTSIAMFFCVAAMAADNRDNKDALAPVIRSVEPATAKPGDILVAAGEGLDKTKVADLFLTDTKTDLKVVMLDQQSGSIRFKVPAGVVPGRYLLMIMTKGETPILLEQPVAVKVETTVR